MEAYAVVQTGGKQYRVKAHDRLKVEKLDAEVGQSINLEPVLAVSDGADLRLGRPVVEGAKVVSKVLEHGLSKKVMSFRKKRRKGYRKTKGHRQEFTVLQVESIA